MAAMFVFSPYQSRARTKKPDTTLVMFGNASWYGARWNGRAMAGGHLFDARAKTAASRTLPFGTLLRVTNMRNGLSVLVTVEDRGPYFGSRVLDLSMSAARQIGMIDQGVARVRIDVIKPNRGGN
jgi:rare lipoprotein A